MASGGAMTFTRLPSKSLASQIGLDSSTRRPTCETIFWQMFSSLRSRPEPDPGLLDLAFDFDEDVLGSVHHDVSDVVASQQRIERTESKQILADLAQQDILLDNRQRNAPKLHDLLDDIRDFLLGLGTGHLRTIA